MPITSDGPRLSPGFAVDKEALIVDLDGVAWWVRPIPMVLVRASGPLASLPAAPKSIGSAWHSDAPPEPEHG
jgi:hypothetical protein